MEMINLEVPKADFSFSDVAKRKANEIIKINLNEGTFISPYIGAFERIISDIEKEYYKFRLKGDRIVFINEFLIHIFNLKIKYSQTIDTLIAQSPADAESYNDQRNETFDNMNEMQHHLYGLLIECGYNMDTETFTDSEAIEFDDKIDSIIQALEILKMGQTVLGELFEELKTELDSIKNGKPLGKNISVQRLKGLAVDYAFNKLTDKSVEELRKLLLTVLFVNHKEIYQPLLQLLSGQK